MRSGTSKIWSSPVTAVSGHPTNDESTLSEPNVIYEAGAQVLSGTVYKMWVRGGWDTPHLNYYESTDGVSWTAYGSNPLLTNVVLPFVFKDGSTYYLYYAPTVNTQYDMRTSSDGITWSAATTSILAIGSAGAWDDSVFGNLFVWKESANDWRMIYEAKRAGGAWHLGYATSSDGTSWSKSGSNPVLNETGSNGGPFIYKDAAGTYWMWTQRAISGELPTDIARYSSTNLTSWTRNPYNYVLTRTSIGGNGSDNGQFADITMLTVGDQTYAWFGATTDGTASSGNMSIALAIARLPLAQLVNTSEGY
jgi:hypothetical protein